MKINKRCPFCGKKTEVEVKEKEISAYNRGANILRAFPNMSKFDREVIISGMCYDCQEKTFHTPTPEHEAEWGESLMDCDCCGTPIYSIKDKTDDGGYVCHSCRLPYKLVDGELVCEEDY